MEQKFKSQRPVEISFSQWQQQSNTKEQITAQGVFHCWGQRSVLRKIDPDSPKSFNTQETIGVCELPTGQIRLIKPEKIIFLDRKG